MIVDFPAFIGATIHIRNSRFLTFEEIKVRSWIIVCVLFEVSVWSTWSNMLLIVETRIIMSFKTPNKRCLVSTRPSTILCDNVVSFILVVVVVAFDSFIFEVIV